MSTVEKKGLKKLVPDITKRFVAAKIIDHAMSGKSESLTAGSLAADIGIPIHDVEAALADINGGIQFNIAEPWESVGSFKVKGLSLELEIVQPVLEATTNAHQGETLHRTVTGHDRLVIGGIDHRASVLPIRNDDTSLTNWFSLEIARMLDISTTDEVAELVDVTVFGPKEYESEELAWKAWDDWKESLLDIADVSYWFNFLEPSTCGETNQPLPVIVDEATFHTLCKHCDLEQVPPDGVLTVETSGNLIDHDCHLSAPNGEGRRWPGLDVPGPGEAVSFVSVLVDGRQITCKVEPRFVHLPPATDRFTVECEGVTRVLFEPHSEVTDQIVAEVAAKMFKPATFRVKIKLAGKLKGKVLEAVERDGAVFAITPDGASMELMPSDYERVDERKAS